MKKFIIKNWLVITVTVITGLVMLGGQTADIWFRYDRHAILQGQWWRLLTGNFDHLNVMHWLLNSMGWILVWALYGPLFRNVIWLTLLLLGSLWVGIGLLVFNSDLTYYVGLSGTLHGLFIAGAIIEARTGWRAGGLALLIVLVLKLMFEQLVGSLPGTTDMAGGKVIVDAHLYGAIAGAALLVLMMLMRIRLR